MSHFVRSYYHTEREVLRGVFYTAMRGGHLIADASHDIRRETFAGHEMIYCLRGKGMALIAGQQIEIGAGQLLWVNCWHPHRYRADAEDPWEVYWLRIDGPGLDAYASVLRAEAEPLFGEVDDASWRGWFEKAFEILDHPESADLPSRMHAVLASMLSDLYARRFKGGIGPLGQVPVALAKSLLRMRHGYAEPLRLPELARLAGMSVSHFIRTFRQSMGTSPIDWLRQERINQAKHRLAESDEPIKEIARQCGYRDPYFFSKDFHRVVGMSPSQFRSTASSSTQME